MNENELSHEVITARKCYFINILERANDGGYIPCIAVENEKGYYKTTWNWGSDLKLAEQIAQEMNEKLGLTPRDCAVIELSTISLR